jgi:hypothetical protein
LHSRYLELGNNTGSVALLDAAALTEGPGPHPLFNGISRVLITGLQEAPQVTQEGDSVLVEAKGVTARFAGAELERGDRRIQIRVPPGAP